MKCPKCGLDAIISASENRVEGDSSPNTQTRLWRVLTFSCRNKQCENCGLEIGQEKLELTLAR